MLYEYVKIQRKILLEDALAMIFIDFGLLRGPYWKYLTYFMKSTDLDKSRFRNCAWQCCFDFPFWKAFSFYCVKMRVKIWQPTYDSVCEDNSWIHGKCRQHFYQTFTNIFVIFCPRFFTFFNVFLIFTWTFVASMFGPKALAGCTSVTDDRQTDRQADHAVVTYVAVAVSAAS